MKKGFLFFIFLLSGSANAFELQFGFPYFFSGKMDQRITSQWKAGIGFGAIPFSAANLFYHPTINANVSDEYSILIDPDLRALSTSLYADWMPFVSSSYFRLEFLVNFLGVGAKTYIQNRASQIKAPYMEVEATAIFPRLVLSYAGKLGRFESWDLEGGVGMQFLFASLLSVNKTGPAASYFDAVPTARPSVDDGIANLETELSSTLSDSVLGTRFLPSFWIAARW